MQICHDEAHDVLIYLLLSISEQNFIKKTDSK